MSAQSARKWAKDNPRRHADNNARNARLLKERNDAIRREAKDVPCHDCGRRFPYYVMQFDHRDRTEKKHNVGDMHQHSVEKLLDEIAKCDVVCSNCHAVRTWGS